MKRILTSKWLYLALAIVAAMLLFLPANATIVIFAMLFLVFGTFMLSYYYFSWLYEDELDELEDFRAQCEDCPKDL